MTDPEVASADTHGLIQHFQPYQNTQQLDDNPRKTRQGNYEWKIIIFWDFTQNFVLIWLNY